MSWFRRQRLTADEVAEIAEILYRGCVEDEMETLEPSYFTIPDALCSAYVAKAKLYRQATLLYSLLGKSRTDPSYEPLVRACEARIFPAKPSEGLQKLGAIKDAMCEIADLADPANEKRLSWSAKWLAGIGYHNPNVANVALFGIAWTDFYIATRRIVERTQAQ